MFVRPTVSAAAPCWQRRRREIAILRETFADEERAWLSRAQRERSISETDPSATRVQVLRNAFDVVASHVGFFLRDSRRYDRPRRGMELFEFCAFRFNVSLTRRCRVQRLPKTIDPFLNNLLKTYCVIRASQRILRFAPSSASLASNRFPALQN